MIRRTLFTLLTAIICLTSRGQQTDSTLVHKNATPHIAISTASGFALSAGSVQLLKHLTDRPRPDHSEGSAMPSRHAAWAWNLTTLAAFPLCAESAWWAPALQLGSSAISQQRIMADKHHPGDVMVGMAIGIGSAGVGQVIANWICGNPHRYPKRNTYAMEGSHVLEVTSGFKSASGFGDLWSAIGQIFTLGLLDEERDIYLPVYGYNTDITLGFIHSDRVTYKGSIGLTTYQLNGYGKHEGKYMGTINAIDALVGIGVHNTSNIKVQVDIMAGARYIITDMDCNKWCPTAKIKFGVYPSITKHLSVGPSISFNVFDVKPLKNELDNLAFDFGLSLDSRVCF